MSFFLVITDSPNNFKKYIPFYHKESSAFFFYTKLMINHFSDWLFRICVQIWSSVQIGERPLGCHGPQKRSGTHKNRLQSDLLFSVEYRFFSIKAKRHVVHLLLSSFASLSSPSPSLTIPHRTHTLQSSSPSNALLDQHFVATLMPH